MPFVKGTSGNPAGRPQGSKDRATINARAAIADFVEGNADRLCGWLDAIANGEKKDDDIWIRRPDPKAAFDCYMSVIEYNIPKLARTEHAGDQNNPVRHTFSWEDANKAHDNSLPSPDDISSLPSK